MDHPPMYRYVYTLPAVCSLLEVTGSYICLGSVFTDTQLMECTSFKVENQEGDKKSKAVGGHIKKLRIDTVTYSKKG